MDGIDRAYKSIGEFVVVFQWAEDQYRQIGWFILDPERENWPPVQLRKETNQELVDKVTELFVGLTQMYNFPNGPERRADFEALRLQFHEMRKFRNRLLHSTYLELKVGGELRAYVRSNPKIGVDPDTGELIYDQEPFSEDVVHSKIKEYADAMFRLGDHYIQLIHWYPFERFKKP